MNSLFLLATESQLVFGDLGASHQKVVVSLGGHFQTSREGTEGVLDQATSGRRVPEGVEKERGREGGEGTILIPSVQHF